jgi:GDP-mannose 6-dehydrogenase
MEIGVIGMGYVGLIGSVCLAVNGHKVIGMDVDEQKISKLKRNILPIYETNLDDYFEKAINSGNLTFTNSLKYLIENTDICFVCVGTPSDKNGKINLDYVRNVSENIGKELRNKKDFYVVCFRSTISCGTSLNLIIPKLEKESGKKHGKDFGYAFNPEFLREGSAIYDFYNPPKTVIGTNDKKTLDILMDIYKDLPEEKLALPIVEAEMIKYADNIWHAIKIAFANEIGSIAKSFGGDGRLVMETFCKDKKLNISPIYLKPGFAFGGSCLPKDVRGILSIANDKNKDIPLISSILSSNYSNIKEAFDLISSNTNKNERITIIGIAFKPGTDDTRESPAIFLAKMLQDNGYSLRYYDPFASYDSVLLNFGNDFIKIDKTDFFHSLDDAINNSTNIVLTGSFNKMPKEKDLYLKTKIFDLNGIFYNDKEIKEKCNYYAICW